MTILLPLLPLLACGEPTCPDGQKFDEDGLCVEDTGSAETDADTDADSDADADADTDTDADTDADADSDADSDTDTDTDADAAPEDTAFAYLWFVGDGGTTDGAWAGGQLGAEWSLVASYPDTTPVCSVGVDWVDAGPARVDPCEGCDWTFHLVTDNVVEDADACLAGGVVAGQLGTLDYDFGWAAEWVYEYGEETFPLPSVLLFYYPSYGWYPIVYDGTYASVTGDGSAFSFRAFQGYDYYYTGG